MSTPLRKPRSNYKIGSMTPEQREMLEAWLFDNNLAYKTVQKRADEKFGVELSLRTLGRFYHRIASKRIIRHLTQGSKQADDVVKACEKHPGDMFKAVSNAVGQIAFEAAVKSAAPAKEGEKPDLKPVQERLELLLAVRKEERESRKFALEREKWEFDVTGCCLKNLAELRHIASDKTASGEDKLTRARRLLFGDLPE